MVGRIDEVWGETVETCSQWVQVVSNVLAEFVSAYIVWDAHVEIAIAAALGSVLTVLPGLGLSDVRIIALPIAGSLLVIGYRLPQSSSSLFDYLSGLSGLKQVTVASLPALVFVRVTSQSVFDLLQTSYWVLGITALFAILAVILGDTLLD